jgi:hypothetical protein
MRVQVVYNFYLDYQLPMLDGLEPVQIETRIGDCDAWVRAWNPAVEPLYYSDNGATLSNSHMTISPVGRPEATLTFRARDRIIDRLLVALEWDSDDAPVGNAELVDKRLTQAVRLANIVIDHLRAATRTPRIERIRRYWKPGEPRFAITAPHTEAWFNQDDGSGLLMFNGLNSLNSLGAIEVPYTGAVTKAILERNMGASAEAPLHLALLVDAEDDLMALDLREAVITVASALEARARAYAEAQIGASRMTKSAVESILGARQKTFAEKHYADLPTAACGRTLHQDDPVAFDAIQSAYQERNELMHAGRFTNAFVQAEEIERLRACELWLRSAYVAVDWLDSLPS